MKVSILSLRRDHSDFHEISASWGSRLVGGIKLRSSANFYAPQNCKCVPGVSWTAAATQRAVKVGLIASQEIYRKSSVFRSFGPRIFLPSRRDAVRLRISRLETRGSLERSTLTLPKEGERHFTPTYYADIIDFFILGNTRNVQ